ncbi:hypothetical protein [Bacillus sp. Cr_A10]|uniref:hypothetical protein n=1 Tax=Bacillus sp. Cr_A10 TaxID=3033993 RepID=UPI0023DCB5FF|nr:hypothetical protein [Bacillus sp. Cr_A10]MDF2067638.1 hypothetical protein [Bacillus sp. Cr_A10]
MNNWKKENHAASVERFIPLGAGEDHEVWRGLLVSKVLLASKVLLEQGDLGGQWVMRVREAGLDSKESKVLLGYLVQKEIREIKVKPVLLGNKDLQEFLVNRGLLEWQELLGYLVQKEIREIKVKPVLLGNKDLQEFLVNRGLLEWQELRGYLVQKEIREIKVKPVLVENKDLLG